jgi:energy-coupling factor transporter ATP-binding protein EcfA2
MKKRFNDTGVCIPERNYMVDISGKISRIFRMISQGDYFVISRPNQYGKTTTIYMLNMFLKKSREYFPVQVSFEGIGSESYLKEAAFIEAFMLRLEMLFEVSGYKELGEFIRAGSPVDNIDKLSPWITRLVKKIGKKVVLMIDEVDKSSNNRLFLDFLGMLREKYLKSKEGLDSTFHSVILVGVHDIKSLKIKLRSGGETRYNSPWNIAVDFDIDMDFSPEEISSMLEED